MVKESIAKKSERLLRVCEVLPQGSQRGVNRANSHLASMVKARALEDDAISITKEPKRKTSAMLTHIQKQQWVHGLRETD